MSDPTTIEPVIIDGIELRADEYANYLADLVDIRKSSSIEHDETDDDIYLGDLIAHANDSKESVVYDTVSAVDPFLESFFDGLDTYNGTPFKKSDITQRHRNIVFRLQFADCIELFYDFLKEYGYNKRADLDMLYGEDYDPEDETLNPAYIALFHELSSRALEKCVPKRFLGGILIVYLAICLGYNID